jgi:Xaa-Pro aminopeptidase
LKYAGVPAQEKLDALYADLQKQAVDCAVLTVGESLCWLFNLRGGDVPYTPLMDGFAIVHKEGSFDLFVSAPKVTPEVGTYIAQQGGHLYPYDAFEGALRALGAQKKRVLLDLATAPCACEALLQKNGAQIVAGQDPCTVPKARKNTTEIQGAIEAHFQDALALTSFLSWLDTQRAHQQSVTELQASDYLLKQRMKCPDFKEMSFETIAGSGPHGAIIHYRASTHTNRTLQEGELFLVDSGGQYLSGTTDVTRTIFWGEKPSALQKEHFTRVLKGHIALAKAHFPRGTSGHQLDALARIALWEVGLDYAHGTGHGVGSYLGVHEGPQSISPAPRHVPLELGMIVSNEPGYYLENQYGIRIESLQFVKESPHKKGQNPFYTFEMLTLAPIDNTLIDITLLTHSEQKWLNAYHARVWETLSPHLEKNVCDWLFHKTRPL